PGEFAAFHGGIAAPDAYARDPAALAAVAKPVADLAPSGYGNPPGFAEHRAAFSASGVYGRWIRSHNVAIKIDRTLFVHAGSGPKYAGWPLERLNDQVRQELSDFTRLHGGIVTDEEGPLWYQGLAKGDQRETQPLVDQLLRHFDVDRIAIGHTYANAAVTPR